jgi:hypothetical protein
MTSDARRTPSFIPTTLSQKPAARSVTRCSLLLVADLPRSSRPPLSGFRRAIEPAEGLPEDPSVDPSEGFEAVSTQAHELDTEVNALEVREHDDRLGEDSSGAERPGPAFAANGSSHALRPNWRRSAVLGVVVVLVAIAVVFALTDPSPEPDASAPSATAEPAPPARRGPRCSSPWP